MSLNNYALKFDKTASDRIDFTGGALGASIKNISNFTLEAWIKVGAFQKSSNQRFYLERQGTPSTNKLPRLGASAWNESQTNYTYSGTITSITSVTFSDTAANFSNVGVQPGAHVLVGTKLGIVASVPTTTTIVVEAWIDSVTFASVAAPTVSSAYTITGVRAARGKLRFEFARVDGTTDTNYTYTRSSAWDDYWHHVVFTVDIGSKNYEIYVDGGRVQTGKLTDGGLDGSSNPLKVSNTAPQHIIVGAHYDGTNYTYFDGKLDCVRVWSSVRSQTAIQANQFDHLLDPVTETSLLEEWKFNEGSGTTTAGSKNGSWTGTLKRNGSSSSALWNSDRSFMGDATNDETPPPNPTANVPTNITNNSFDVSWTSVNDNVYTQYYELTVATDSSFNNPVTGFSGLNVGRVLSKTITGLNQNQVHYWRVRAVDAALNTSAWVMYNSNQSVTTLSGDVDPPSVPTLNAATSITASQFNISWTTSTDPGTGVAGYKIDVAIDSNFVTYAPGWRNVDLGLVTSTTISSINPSTTYYVRVRAYDVAENESNDSNAVTVTTSDPPDTTPPSVIVLQPATGISGTGFTANWNMGVDDVGIASYVLDVSTDIGFGSFVSVYNAFNVGTVISYAVTGLDPEVGYYYRVRALDAAGNVSANTTDPEPVTTRPRTVEDGGLVAINFDPTEDTYVNQASTGTNFGLATTMSVDNTGAAIKRAYMRFDLTGLIGTIVNANLQINITDASAGVFSVSRVSAGTWVETTLTYTNDTLTRTGQVDFNPASTGILEVDVGSLLVSGNTSYTLAITTTSTDILTFESREGTIKPMLVVEVDPTNATEHDRAILFSNNFESINYAINPGAEIGGPSFGGVTGITALVSAALTQSVTHVYGGTYACQVVTALSANSGVKFVSGTGVNMASNGQTIKASARIYGNAAMTLTMRVNAYYTDATSTLGTPVSLTVKASFNRFECSVLLVSGKTIDRLEVEIYNTAATALTYWVDAVLITNSPQQFNEYFDGSFFGARWLGTANASFSSIWTPILSWEAFYFGDADADNTMAAAYRPVGETNWIVSAPVTAFPLRAQKRWIGTFGSFYDGNWLLNPSFEDSTNNWQGNASGSVLSLDTAQLVQGNYSLNVVCDGTLVNQGVTYSPTQQVPGVNTNKFTFSAFIQSISGATGLQLVVQERDTNGAVLATQTSNITITSTFARYSNTFTLANVSCAYVTAAIRNANATASSYFVDCCQLEKNDAVTPYIDGDIGDGVWTGIPHKSTTYRRVRNEVAYEVLYTWTDSDGIQGVNPHTLSFTTPIATDNYATVVSLALTATNTEIQAVLTYTGDANLTAVAVAEWKRSDLSAWSKVRATWDRSSKLINSTISNLKPGVSYNVRFTVSDLNALVLGPNPITQTITTTTTGLHSDSKERITFGGYVLMGEGQDMVWVNEHDALGHPDRRTQIEEVPRVDGAIELSDYWGKRRIRMSGGVRGATRQELADNLAILRKALSARKQRLVVDSVVATNYYLTATCTQLSITERAGDNLTHLMWDATFECADPFRYESAETLNAGIVLSNAQETNITNDGDVYTEPVITVITNNPTDITFTLINKTTGERLKPLTPIHNGDKLVISTQELSVTKNGVEVDYEGTFPRLVSGPNTIRVELSASSVTLDIRRRHRYI